MAIYCALACVCAWSAHAGVVAEMQSSGDMVCCQCAGYGAGIGFFFRNMAALTEHFRVHAVDLLGTGMSGTLP